MKRYVVIIYALLMLALPGCEGDKDETGTGGEIPVKVITSISGSVKCGDTPVPWVVVSDGYSVVRTDSKGEYSIKSDGRNGYVFISTPSGYETAADGGVIPRNFVAISGSGDVKADFALTRKTQERFNIFAFTDLHLSNTTADMDIYQYNNYVLPAMKNTIAEYDGLPLYGLTMGDMTTDTRWYRNNFALPEYLDEIFKLGIPVYHTMGNHDNDPYIPGDWPSAATYRGIVGPNYYSFNIGSWHFVSLDNIIYNNAAGKPGVTSGASDYVSGFSEEAFNWFVKDLAYVDKSTPLLIFLHCSTPNIKAADRTKFLNALAGYEKVLILSGHHHCMNKITHSLAVKEHNNPPPGGVNWGVYGPTGIRITNDGTPGGFHVYQFDGREVKWKFHTTDYGSDYQFRAMDLNTIPVQYGGKSNSNEVLINVFDWDENWTVSVKAGSTPLVVNKVSVQDPLYNFAMDKAFPGTTSGVRYSKNVTHIFSAKASNATSTLLIEVTDGFGRKYSQTMTRPKAFGFTME